MGLRIRFRKINKDKKGSCIEKREPFYAHFLVFFLIITVDNHRYDAAGNAENGIDHPCTVPQISEKTASEKDHGCNHHNAAADDTDFFIVFVGLRIVVMHQIVLFNIVFAVLRACVGKQYDGYGYKEHKQGAAQHVKINSVPYDVIGRDDSNNCSC